jgi:hypothetical protein
MRSLQGRVYGPDTAARLAPLLFNDCASDQRPRVRRLQRLPSGQEHGGAIEIPTAIRQLGKPVVRHGASRIELVKDLDARVGCFPLAGFLQPSRPS